MIDPARNFAIVTVSTIYDADDVSIALVTGNGARLPQPSTEGAFNLTWWNSTDYNMPHEDPEREIVRVTARSGDTLTVVRGQEGISASIKNRSGKTYLMALTLTKKTIDDIRDDLDEANDAIEGKQDQDDDLDAISALTGEGLLKRHSNGTYTLEEAQTVSPEDVQDIVAEMVEDGTGISWDYDDDLGTLTPAVSLSPFDTDDLAEGSGNLYYTTARANGAFDTRIATKTTSDLAEGSNLYYTTARMNSDFDTRLATKSTSDLSEGSNLYYTDVRADARITAQKAQINGLATLDGSGKIPTSQLPALAITDTFVVNSQVAMLALTAETGDVAVRTDLNKSYILTASPASTLGNWQELLTPTDTVLSVNGMTGAVTLTTTQIAEGTNLYFTNGRAISAVTGQNVSIFANDAGYITNANGAFVNNATNSTLTRSGSSPYTLGLNLSNANTWLAKQTIQLATQQLSVNYNANNRLDMTVGSTGIVTLDAVGSGGKFVFSDNIEVVTIQSGNGNYLQLTAPAFVQATAKLLVGTQVAPTALFEVQGTIEHARLKYDASNYISLSVSSVGRLTFDANGSGAGFTFADNVTLSGTGNALGTITSGIWNGTAIGVQYGGFGQNMTMQDYSSSGSQGAVPAGLIRYTSNSTLTITGIVAPTTSNFCYIQNSSTSGVIQITHQNSGATAINRVITSSAGTAVIQAGFSAILFYDTTTARWRVHSINYINSVSQPLVVSSSGNLTMPQATDSVSGYLSSSDRASFNSRMQAISGSFGSIPYIYSSNLLLADADFAYNPSTGRLGLGVGLGNEEATIHAKSDTPETLAGLSGISVVLTQFTPLSAPYGYSVTQVAGHLYAPSSLGTSVYASTTFYLAMDTIDYRITAYNSDSGVVYSVVNSIVQAVISTGTGAGDGDAVDITWSDNTGGSATISGYVIERQVNGGGYNDAIDVGLVTAYTDNSTSWNVISLATTFPDFVANNSTRNYSAYSKGTNPAGGDLFSATGYDFAFTDDNSGNPYYLQHNVSTSTTYARILNTDNTTYADTPAFTYLDEDTTQPFVGGTIGSTSFGLQANGSEWNRDYDFYNYNGTIYSLSSGIASSLDPNDGNYYYNLITFGGITTSAKILLDKNLAGYANSETSVTSPLIDDGSNFTSTSMDVTPNSFYRSAGLFEAHGSSLSDPASVRLRSLDGSYTRLDFLKDDDTLLGYIEQGATALTVWSDTVHINIESVGGLYAGSSPSLRLGWSSGGVAMYVPTSGTIGLVYNSIYHLQVDSAGLKLAVANTNKIGLWGATPIVQPTTSIASASFTANSGTAVNDASTFDGYTLKQAIKALRNMGALA
jgi:hypothetical protein